MTMSTSQLKWARVRERQEARAKREDARRKREEKNRRERARRARIRLVAGGHDLSS